MKAIWMMVKMVLKQTLNLCIQMFDRSAGILIQAGYGYRCYVNCAADWNGPCSVKQPSSGTGVIKPQRAGKASVSL